MRGIYQIKNNVTGDLYIGSSIDVFKRWRTHVHRLHKQAHSNEKLQIAWNEYGVTAFSFAILQIVESGQNLLDAEGILIAKLQPTYNGTITTLSQEERHAPANYPVLSNIPDTEVVPDMSPDDIYILIKEAEKIYKRSD